MLKAHDETINEKPTGENRYADHTASEALWKAAQLVDPNTNKKSAQNKLRDLKRYTVAQYLSKVRIRFVSEIVSKIVRVEILKKIDDEKMVVDES